MIGMGFSGCQRNRIYENRDAKLSFSSDLIAFDTIFTSINSITKTLTVHNPYNSAVLTDITLLGGEYSYYSLNINGIPAKTLKQVKIPAKDSIFIFIKVLINPNGGNAPLLVCDTLAFLTNGNRQHVALVACGEDAHFILPDSRLPVLSCRDTFYMNYRVIAAENTHVQWVNDKPYVIYGWAVVDENAKLTIDPGVRIYCHNQSGIWVYTDGCIDVQGTKDQPVTFQSDRREMWFAQTPNQWGGISINPSHQVSNINYAVVKHAAEAIAIGTMAASSSINKLILSNTLIEYSGTGLRSFNSNVEAHNNVIAYCQDYCVRAALGGNYQFVNNTFYNYFYGSSIRTTPSVYLANYHTRDSCEYSLMYNADFNGLFYNNIVWGSQEKVELLCSKSSHASFQLDVQNSLIKMNPDHVSSFSVNQNNIIGSDPLLRDPNNEDFTLQDISPCIGKGKQDPLTPVQDKAGNSRNNPPCIGAFEY
jgi:hypothetical protein